MADQKAKPKTITMFGEWAIVDQISKATGLNSTSAATRFIIRDWRRLKDQYEPAPNCSQNVRESGTLEAAQ